MMRPGMGVLVLLAAAACSDGREVAPIEVPPVERTGREEPDVPSQPLEPTYRHAPGPSGIVEGTVRWRGPRPANPTLEVHMQHGVCGRAQQVPAVVVGRGGGVAHALVTVEGIDAGPRPIPDEPALLDQVGCRYEPHVLGMVRGQTVVFRNSDQVLHNVHAIWEDDEEWFNVGQPRQGMSTRQVPERTGVARVVCDAGHAWMLAWVHVLDHPYFATTDAEGRFRIEGVPPGSHSVRLWHQGWETVGQESGRLTFADPVVVTRTVEVSADQPTTFELTIPPEPPAPPEQ